MSAAVSSLRFVPSAAEGLPSVSEVVVHPDRLEVKSQGKWLTFPFKEIARPQESRLLSIVKRLFGTTPCPPMVADKDWFHPPKDRFFRWYTQPPLVTLMPEDELEEYGASYFVRIQEVLRSGGYAAFDLG